MRRAAAALVLAVLAACRPDAAGPARFHATVAAPTGGTLTFSLPVAAQACADDGGLLLRGIDGAHGVLVWIFAAGGAETGAFTIGDAEADVPGRHARVTVRYETDGMVHAVALDSGTVRLEAVSPVTGSLGGAGLAIGAGQRPLVRGVFRGVAVGPDTARCRADSTAGS